MANGGAEGSEGERDERAAPPAEARAGLLAAV
jgi:hypothetical protein